jgi:hypothetical protein
LVGVVEVEVGKEIMVPETSKHGMCSSGQLGLFIKGPQVSSPFVIAVLCTLIKSSDDEAGRVEVVLRESVFV